MNWQKVLNIIFGICLLVSLIAVSILTYKLNKQSAPEVIELTDTIVLTKNDTIFKEKIRYITKFDTTIILEHDSIKDTIYISLPNEHKEATFETHKDSIDLLAKILYHGYKAEIDTVEFSYNFHYTLEIPKKEKKWGIVWNIGPYLGYGINFNNGQYYFSPEVGIGGSIGIGGIIK